VNYLQKALAVIRDESADPDLVSGEWTELVRGMLYGIESTFEPHKQTIFPAIQGWFSDRECLALARCAALFGFRTLEFGAWKGRSTLAVALAGELITTVDTWRGDEWTGLGDFMPEFRANVERYANPISVVALMTDWNIVEKIIELANYHVFHYDAGHSFDQTFNAVSGVLYAWRDGYIRSIVSGATGGITGLALPHKGRNRIIAVHDWDYPDVRKATEQAIGYECQCVFDRLGLFYLPNGYWMSKSGYCLDGETDNKWWTEAQSSFRKKIMGAV
jgi:hypothetical protein